MIERDRFASALAAALRRIRHPRFYETERGFQGALVAELLAAPAALGLPTAEFIVEQEHQKRLGDHGLQIRPDIIIHVPFRAGFHRSRKEENFVLFELKRAAGAADARGAYESIAAMIRELDYELGVFVNIDSTDLHLEHIPEDVVDRTVAVAAHLEGDGVILTGI